LIESNISISSVCEIVVPLANFSINNWTRGDRVGPHGSDIGLAWDLGTLDPGEYTIEITMTEQGKPWVNTTELIYTISIAQTTVLA
jgi:hypothetical protein